MERASNRSYSLRGNRMTRAQTLAMAQSWDQYAIEIKSELNLNQIFPEKTKVIMLDYRFLELCLLTVCLPIKLIRVFMT